MVIRYGRNKLEIADQEGDVRIDIPLPLLGGEESEFVPPMGGEVSSLKQFTLWKNGGLAFGLAGVPLTSDTVEASAYGLYQELFGLLEGKRLYRIWNYAPGINVGEGDTEIYKLFSKGRSEAFREYFGDDDEASMPSGSCLGADGDQLIVLFLAGDVEPSHHENPQQVPAYRYPRRYGPKSPSFARATSVKLEDAFYRFISGTAAVVGSESIGIDDVRRQLEVTCDNLEIVEKQSRVALPENAVGVEEVLGKVYLRNAEDFTMAKDYLEQRLPAWSKHFVYLSCLLYTSPSPRD